MASESSSALASSFTDLMTSLAVIFILLLVAIMQKTVMAAAARTQHTEKTRGDILAELQRRLGEPGVNVKKDPNDPLSLLVVVPEELMFKVNEDHVSNAGQQFLGRFIPRFAQVICRDFRNEITSVAVEGHTDSTGKANNPLDRDIYNLDLSQDRSREVEVDSLKVLYNDESDLRAYYSCFLTLLTASGRGSNDLIPLEDGMEDFAKSRRVEFRIRVRSFEQREREVPTGEAALNILQAPRSHSSSGELNGNQPSRH